VVTPSHSRNGASTPLQQPIVVGLSGSGWASRAAGTRGLGRSRRSRLGHWQNPMMASAQTPRPGEAGSHRKRGYWSRSGSGFSQAQKAAAVGKRVATRSTGRQGASGTCGPGPEDTGPNVPPGRTTATIRSSSPGSVQDRAGPRSLTSATYSVQRGGQLGPRPPGLPAAYSASVSSSRSNAFASAVASSPASAAAADHPPVTACPPVASSGKSASSPPRRGRVAPAVAGRHSRTLRGVPPEGATCSACWTGRIACMGAQGV
jgi:hypothetical protein